MSWKNNIFNEDCLEGMKRMPDNSVDMVFADLPYGTTACSWDIIIPFEPLWKQLKRVGKENCPYIFTASQPFTTKLIDSNIDWFRYEWIWEKQQGTNPLTAKIQPLKKHENVAVFYQKLPTYNPQFESGTPYSGFETKDGATIGEVYDKQTSKHAANSGFRYPTSIIRKNTDRDKEHPTKKPVPLLTYFIKTYSNKGDVILDPTIGSGTTAVAAIQTFRNYVGFETDEKYYESALERISKVKRETEKRRKFFDFGG